MEEKEIESNKISIDSIIDTVNNKNEVIQKTKKSELVNEGFFDMLSQMGVGGNVVMIILFILSFFTIYILIERYLTLKKITTKDKEVLSSVIDMIKTNNLDEVKEYCKKIDTPFARISIKAIENQNLSQKEISIILENQAKKEIYEIENNVSKLATISGAAPMIGFLGTVIGMIVAFQEMARQPSVNPTDLASGIYTAMITTAAGLAVGIISYISYNYMVTKIDNIVFNLEHNCEELIQNILKK